MDSPSGLIVGSVVYNVFPWSVGVKVVVPTELGLWGLGTTEHDPPWGLGTWDWPPHSPLLSSSFLTYFSSLLFPSPILILSSFLLSFPLLLSLFLLPSSFYHIPLTLFLTASLSFSPLPSHSPPWPPRFSPPLLLSPLPSHPLPFPPHFPPLLLSPSPLASHPPPSPSLSSSPLPSTLSPSPPLSLSLCLSSSPFPSSHPLPSSPLSFFHFSLSLPLFPGAKETERKYHNSSLPLSFTSFLLPSLSSFFRSFLLSGYLPVFPCHSSFFLSFPLSLLHSYSSFPPPPIHSFVISPLSSSTSLSLSEYSPDHFRLFFPSKSFSLFLTFPLTLSCVFLTLSITCPRLLYPSLSFRVPSPSSISLPLLPFSSFSPSISHLLPFLLSSSLCVSLLLSFRFPPSPPISLLSSTSFPSPISLSLSSPPSPSFFSFSSYISPSHSVSPLPSFSSLSSYLSPSPPISLPFLPSPSTSSYLSLSLSSYLSPSPSISFHLPPSPPISLPLLPSPSLSPPHTPQSPTSPSAVAASVMYIHKTHGNLAAEGTYQSVIWTYRSCVKFRGSASNRS
ncbi:hypothetical protein C7M84_018161 [Penaeus vannamei]|uniref:Uncharacterized protein n=1 Tax=Penaeus vannamei TaxID=6689 RepID=A0A423SI68_PENVA|nr:hypothetical protein C7M84_018161 [Penaeus vannamei]